MYSIGDNMKINKTRFLQIALFLLAGILICFSAEARNGAALGLILAQKVVIPSLLPLLIIFNFLQELAASNPENKLQALIMHKLFRLPGHCFNAVLFGLIGGYPAGTLLTAALYDNNKINKSEASRMMRFNFCGGAGFIITAVGTGILKSKKAGLILFASAALAAIVCGITAGIFSRKGGITQVRYASSCNCGDSLSKSVEAAVRSVLNLTAYIVLFCAFQSIIKVPELFTPVVEITSGITVAGNTFSLPQTAFLISFGGFCVHLQIFPVLKKIQFSYLKFFAWRLFSSVLSYMICTLLLQIFPQEKAVFSNFSDGIVRATSINASLSVLMLLGSAVLIFDLENRKKRLL